MTSLTIARLTFREASRRWVVWAALLLGTVFLLVYGLGFREILQGLAEEAQSPSPILRKTIYNFYMMAGLYVVNFLTVIMTVLTSVDTLSGEISTGTVHTLVSKPIHRREIVLGKWLGYMAMLTLYLLLMAGGVMLVVYSLSGYVPNRPAAALGLMWLNVTLLLCVSLLGGVLMSTLSNGVMVFGMYSIAFIGGWIEQIGSFIENQTAANIGIISSLLFPSEALWKRAAYELQSPISSLAGGMTPFSSVSAPSTLMIGYAALYAALALYLAVRIFNRRDL
jgi:Cu-processing system permease protein